MEEGRQLGGQPLRGPSRLLARVGASLAPVASKTMLREAVSRASAVRCRTLFGVGECVSLHETNARPAPSPCDAARQEIFIKGKTKKRKKAYTSVTSKRVVRSSVWPGRKGGMPSSHTNPETAETQRRASCTAHRAHTRARPSSAAHLWPRSPAARAACRNGARFVARTRTHTDSRECARGARFGGGPAAAATRA